MFSTCQVEAYACVTPSHYNENQEMVLNNAEAISTIVAEKSENDKKPVYPVQHSNDFAILREDNLNRGCIREA